MIVSPNGSQMTQGQTVLDLGCERRHRRVRVPVRAQRRRHAGRRRVVAASAPRCCTSSGVEAVIDRKAEGYKFWNDEGEQDPSEWRRFGKKIRELVGHATPTSCSSTPVAQTMGASVFVAKRGGMIITCAATSGFMIEYDNRYLWMNLKTLKGCHFANYREAWEANRLIAEGKIFPTLSKVFALERHRRGRVPGAPQPARGQARRPLPRAGRGPRRDRRRDARAAAPADHAVPQVRLAAERT